MRNEKKSAGTPLTILALLILVLPFLYVLSIGPAAGLATRGYIDAENNTLKMFYAPIAWSVDNFPVCRVILEPYVKLWMPPE